MPGLFRAVYSKGGFSAYLYKSTNVFPAFAALKSRLWHSIITLRGLYPPIGAPGVPAEVTMGVHATERSKGPFRPRGGMQP